MEDAFRNASHRVQAGPYASRGMASDGMSSFGPRSLETFMDLGLSDLQIARYFRTSETSVISLRQYYGLS